MKKHLHLSLVAVFAASILSACQTTKDTFPEVIGAHVVPRGLNLCTDYGASRHCDGASYRAYYRDGVVTRHHGLDFKAPPGTPVISGSFGTIKMVIHDDPCGGGEVAVEPDFRYPDPRAPGSGQSRFFLYYDHIVPTEDMKYGLKLKPGDLIGHIQKPAPGQHCIGGMAHVHMEAAYSTRSMLGNHIDPNKFWADGPGIVTCFNPDKPPPHGTLVAPLRCE